MKACWVKFPSGCPRQKNEKYKSLQNTKMWHHENFRSASSSQQQCYVREKQLNGWCGISDVIVRYGEGIAIF